MKGLIVLQRNFSKIYHAVAVELHRNYGVKNFCGYVSRKAESFARSQKDIQYTNILVNEDVHDLYKKEKLDLDYIKNLEKEYGIPNMWPYVGVDRTLTLSIPPKFYSGLQLDPAYSHEEMLRLIQATARAIISFLDSEKPDFILFPTPPGSLGPYLLYEIAKKRNIKTFMNFLTTVGQRITLSEDYRTFSGPAELFHEKPENISDASYQKAREFLKNFREKYTIYDQRPEYIKRDPRGYLKFLKPIRFLKAITGVINHTAKYIADPHKNDYNSEPPFYYIKNRLQQKLRDFRGVRDLYDEADYEENFAFFPLHFEPEVSILLLAPFFRDQLYLARLVARSLPVHFKLYLKEHPIMQSYRPRWFYKELKRIPSVKLIDPTKSTFDILKHSKLVTSITGTAGWEAVLLKKPVITFGETFYNEPSFVKKCKTPEELPYLIKKQLERFAYDESELERFVAAIIEDSIEGDYLNLYEHETDRKKIQSSDIVQGLAENLAKKMHLL